MEDEILSEDSIDKAIVAAEYALELGEKMKRLEENQDFIDLFKTHFIDDWAITNTVNMANNTQEIDKRVFEKMKARGHFCKFCEDLKEDANYAKESLLSFRKEQDK